MNYSNYYSYYPMTYPFLVNTIPYPYPNMFMNPYFNPNIQENPVSQAQEVKKQYHFDEVNFSDIQMELRKLHFLQPNHKKIHWTLQEDAILERLVQIQKIEWKEMPKYFEGRTQNMCYSRYRRISLATKQRAWTSQEQQQLSNYVNRFGQKWKFISQKMPKFTPKQIRQRYLNYLRPNINKQNFSFEQDLKICELVLNHGKHWRKMEQNFINRPQGVIKGRYYGKLKQIIKKAAKNTN